MTSWEQHVKTQHPDLYTIPPSAHAHTPTGNQQYNPTFLCFLSLEIAHPGDAALALPVIEMISSAALLVRGRRSQPRRDFTAEFLSVTALTLGVRILMNTSVYIYKEL